MHSRSDIIKVYDLLEQYPPSHIGVTRYYTLGPDEFSTCVLKAGGGYYSESAFPADRSMRRIRRIVYKEGVSCFKALIQLNIRLKGWSSLGHPNWFPIPYPVFLAYLEETYGSRTKLMLQVLQEALEPQAA
ncbi:MAG: hypothetical protein EOO60_04630 [Hymenobacter sp.]|nr:MAG: hypothetical protein EOO60_04630 [Hymenobacter sp.]